MCHQMIRELASALGTRDRRIAQLMHRLEQLLRQRYGRRAEKVDPNQLALFARELLEVAQAEPVRPEAPPASQSRRANGHGRRRLPKDLPRKRVEYPVPADELPCPECGHERVKIGEEVSEQLEYVPASLYVVEHVRPKYACRQCEGHVVIAGKPYQPIEKGLPGPGLLAHVITSKYADHLPLHRMEGILRRHGVEISRSTTCGWMASCADLLEPLWRIMKKEVLTSRVIHTDDTPVPVQDEDRDRTRTARLWVYVGDRRNPHTVFDYTPNRSRDGPVRFLGDYEGYLQADAFGGYDGIYAAGKVKEVACWAHARRKFFEAQTTDPARALEAVARIKRFYEVEDETRELSPEERQKLRAERSQSLLNDFRHWLDARSQEVLPKSPLGEAIRYARGNWEALVRYVEDGELAIDNNAAERALRCVAVGRKNWMFVGSDRGGRTAAILYSFVATCKVHGIDPFAYLRDVLTRYSAHPARRIAELLPSNWKPAQNPCYRENSAQLVTR